MKSPSLLELPFANLPTLGLGASLSLSADPDPISLTAARNGPSFVEYAGLVDFNRVENDVSQLLENKIPILFHPSFINFCGSFENDGLWLKKAREHISKVNSPWFAQDCAYCFWDNAKGYSGQFGYFIPPIFNENSLATAISRVKEVQDHIQTTVAIEPPPLTFTIGTMPLFEFFGRLAEETDCAILLDMGHLVSYEMASKKSLKDELHYLPCERVIEVHIAGGKIKQANDGPVYIDAHESSIQKETWEMFNFMMPHLPNVKAICYECEGVNADEVLKQLSIIREASLQLSSSASLKKLLEVSA